MCCHYYILFLILPSFIWIFKIINCCISNGNLLKICGLDLFFKIIAVLNWTVLLIAWQVAYFTDVLNYVCLFSQSCLTLFYSKGEKHSIWQTTNYISALKGILAGVFFSFFFAKPTVATCVFWCKRGKKEAVIASTSFQVYMKVETWRLNMNSWLKQRRPKILFLA